MDSQERLETKVFWLFRDQQCTECGDVVPEGGLARLEAGKAICLRCAGLDQHVFLPSGDAALTRRATKGSAMSPVVFRFSRTRERNEREGVLVEAAALRSAEEACSRDASARAVRREQSAVRRAAQDRVFVSQMVAAIQQLFPCCPPKEAEAIAEHTTERGSGCIGRSAGGRALDPEAVTAAVVAAVRHRHTDYDELLANGWGQSEAREQVRDAIEEVLKRWRDEAEPRRSTPNQGCLTE